MKPGSLIRGLLFALVAGLSLGTVAVADDQASQGKEEKPAPMILADQNPDPGKKVRRLKDVAVSAPKARLHELLGADPELIYKSAFTAQDIESINAISMDDTFRYAPNLQIRQRYIGDTNGLVTMNGIGNFQQAGIMVFVDGFPLHYHLQSQWNGAPRWELVSPEEVEQVNIIYGAFSALYSGNAMGGVIDIKTHTPEGFEFDMNSTGFVQPYKQYGTDDAFTGFKTHIYVGDRVDRFTYSAFYDHWTTESQPQTFIAATGPFTAAGAQTAVRGAFRDTDPRGNDRIVYGSTGKEVQNKNIFKFKGQYDFTDDFTGRIMVAALDNRVDQTSVENYLTDAAGNKIWGGPGFMGTPFQTQGVAFNIPGSVFSESTAHRQDVLLGLGAKGNLPGNWKFDTAFSLYTYPHNRQSVSSVNPDDPLYTGSGVVSDFKDTGWQTFDMLFANKKFLGNDDLSFFAGYHFDHYSLEIDQYNSLNWVEATRDSLRSRNGGQTMNNGIFAQAAWNFWGDLTATVGGRQEWWQAYRGFKTGIASLSDKSQDSFSPKFSMEYAPEGWHLAFSLARAYRYPIVGELYGDTVFSALGVQIANAGLRREDAFNKAFMIRKDLENGWASLNFFENAIDDLILTQVLSTPPSFTTTFSNIDEVRERGVAFDFHQNGVLTPNLDLVFNTTYVHSEVLANRVDPSVVGNQLPLIAPWRVNGLATYHITDQWDVVTGIHYASRAHARLDNTDRADTFGGTTEQLFVDFKTSYRTYWEGHELVGSFGINNLNNYQAFDFHPYPQRTYYMQVKATY